MYEIINADSSTNKRPGHLRPQIVQRRFMKMQVFDAFELGLVDTLDGEFVIN